MKILSLSLSLELLFCLSLFPFQSLLYTQTLSLSFQFYFRKSGMCVYIPSCGFSAIYISNVRVCSALIRKYDCFPWPSRLSCSHFPRTVSLLDFFIVPILFPALHTLINEFLLFLSFLFTQLRASRSPLCDYCDLFSVVESLARLLLSSDLFLTAITNSHDNPHPSRAPTSRVLPSFFAHELFPLFWRPLSLMSERPEISSSARSRTRFSRTYTHTRVRASKIPDKPPNLFAGNCPQILAGK